ncbi:phage tail tape measure protein [Carnobacterium sp.]|uniref:phage tail tape measure protein n=1 Tax=Carnobacterium sp. TaxID=48221 RepID=UPI00388D657D
MALRKAGISLTLEGQSAYKAGLAEINREQRLMAEQSKLAVAQLGTQASRQQTYSTSMDNYSKRIQSAADKTEMFKNRQKELPGIQNQISKSIKDTNSAYQDSARETDRLKNNYDQMRKALGSNNEETQKAKAAYQASKEETKFLGTEIKNLEKAYNSNEKELSNLPFSLNKAELATQQLRNEAQKLHDEYRNAGGRLAETAENYQKFGNTMTNVGGQMQSIGGKLTTGITLPLAGITAAALTVGISFEKQMSRVGAIAGATADELKQLTDQAKELGASTAFSASEVAAGMENMASAGFATTEILAAMPGVLDLAAVSGGDVALASEAAATAVRAFNLEASDTGHVADVFARAAADTNAEVADMAEAMKYAAPMANTLGMSIEDTAAAIGIMSDAGIKGSQAGTTLRGAFTRLVKPTSKASDAMTEFGIQVFDSQGQIKPMAEIVAELQDSLTGMTSEQKASTLATIFGQEAMSGMMTLVEAGPDKVNELSTSLVNSAGAADEMAKVMQDNAAGAIDEMMGALETAGIEITQLLAPVIRDLAEDITELVGSFSELDDETQRNIIKWAALAMAGGPVLSMLGNITSGFGVASKGASELVRIYGKLTTPKLASDMTTSFTAVAGGATGASTNIAGLIGTIGGLPVVLGVAGAALLGWTAWKVWGEDAWNASERTKQWGTDVGETVDGHLSKMQELTQKTSGQFENMTSGLSTNKNQMSSDFVELGQTIESSLNEHITKLDELMANLPETVRTTLTELLSEDKKKAEESLKIVSDNNKRIQEINSRAAKENRSATISENQIILDLNRESAEAYVNTLQVSQEERNNILNAMNGDVEKSTKEQATSWAKSLAEQRQEMKTHYNEQKETYLSSLKELGYSPKAIEEQAKIWDKANEATTQGIDQQLAIIAAKYPEIAKEISLTNGQTIDSMGELGEQQIAENEKIVQRAGSLSKELAGNAEENAKKLSWVADESEAGAKTWNNIILDPKTGEVKTNVREEVIKAGEDVTSWNEMRFQLHNADLSSNAKSIIGESAIVNGWWDGMAWDDKAVILEDEFSQTTYKALEQSGKWNEMSIEEKTAIMYSNTPEKMTETLAYLNLWEEFEPDIKKVDADNQGFIQSIMGSEEKMNYWRSIPDDVKEIMGENYDLLTTIFQSEDAYNNFKLLSDEEKVFLGENSDLMSTVLQSKTNYNNWVSMPDNEKRLLANNVDLMTKVFSSQKSYNDWRNLPDTLKKIKATTNVPGVSEQSIGALNKVPGLKQVDILAKTNAWATADSAIRAINRVQGKTVKITTQFETMGSPAGAGIGKEKGTNYHLGGPMIVNDQKGPTYKEMITFPNGKSFVPEGRNILIPNAPKGTKVLKAALTKSLVPRYEKGIGYDELSIKSAGSQPAVSINIEINDPVVREEQDINKLSNAVVEKITLNTKLNNLFNKGKGGAYA